MMVWWIVGGVVVASLLLLGSVLVMLRRRLAKLDRVAGLARQRAEQVQRLQQASMNGLQTTLAGVNQRSDLVQQRLARLKGSRRSPPAR